MAIRDVIDANIVPNNNANFITGARLNTTLKAMCSDYEGKDSTEQTARQNADTALANSVTAEATAREAADAALNTAIGAKYTKPANGIPSTDLASGVQTSLSKADTALQEHQSLAAYRTSAAQDVIDAGKADVVEQISVADSVPSQELAPNTQYVFASRTSDLVLTLGTEVEGQANLFAFDIQTGATLPNITMPSGATGSPTFAANKYYSIIIQNNKVFYKEF